MNPGVTVFPAALALLAGCSRELSPTPASPALLSSAPSASAPPAGEAAKTGSFAGVAADGLDRLDKRAPVPLLPEMANHQKQSMRDHLVAVQEVIAALATDDYPAIQRAAGRLGFSEQMGRMCTHMGAGAPGFTELALEFHHTADRIVTAAHDRNRTRVLTELGNTLRICTACHAAWKQQVVDAPTWQKLSSSARPTQGAPH